MRSGKNFRINQRPFRLISANGIKIKPASPKPKLPVYLCLNQLNESTEVRCAKTSGNCHLFQQDHLPALNKISGLKYIHIDAAGQIPGIELDLMMTGLLSFIHQNPNLSAR